MADGWEGASLPPVRGSEAPVFSPRVCRQDTEKSSAKTLPWLYQPWMKTVTVPDDPVVKATFSCVQELDEAQVLALAPPETPMKA